MTKPFFLSASFFHAVIVALVLSSCAVDDDRYLIEPHDARGVEQTNTQASPTSLFLATDRHEAGGGNNLALSLQMAVSRMDVVVPNVVLLGGDYVGKGPDHGETGQPAFSIDDLRGEIARSLNPSTTDVFFTYGSHDRGCTEGYNAFFSGPHRCNGYYIYGISYAQMVFRSDSVTRAAVALFEQQGDDTTYHIEPPRDSVADSADAPRPEPPVQGGSQQRPYNGIDIADPFGISAQSAAAHFSAWVSSLRDNAPIVVMSHVPIHAHRSDNPGAALWFSALSRAAATHDIILFFGHNHSLEERGDSLDQACYLLLPGDSISIQGDSIEGVQRRVLNFTYANAGYLKLGYSTLLTFSDADANGLYDHATLRRFNVTGSPNDYFGSTRHANPYTLTLKAGHKREHRHR